MRTYYAVDDEVDNRPFDAADMREIEAQAKREGITVDQLIEEAGVVRGEDGRFEWREPHSDEHAGMRYAYDERDIFRTEDPLGIEVGNRATEGLVLENGTDDYERNQAQVFIKADARLAQVKAQNKETERALAEFERRAASLDAELERAREIGE
jgi:hypothetical protein